MTNDEKYKLLIERSIQYRGIILHEAIILEKDVDNYISNYFIPDIAKGIEFLELILDRLTFDGKIAILENMLKKKYKSNYNKKGSKLISELKIIKDQRNMFAHYMVYSFYRPEDNIPKEFDLINFRNSTDFKTFSKGDYKLYTERVTNCRIAIEKELEV